MEIKGFLRLQPVFGVVASEVEVLLGVCWFVVDICDDFAIYVFYEDV